MTEEVVERPSVYAYEPRPSRGPLSYPTTRTPLPPAEEEQVRRLLRLLREKLKIRQEELEAVSGMQLMSISRMERGDTRLTSEKVVRYLDAVVRLYGTRMAVLTDTTAALGELVREWEAAEALARLEGIEALLERVEALA